MADTYTIRAIIVRCSCKRRFFAKLRTENLDAVKQFVNGSNQIDCPECGTRFEIVPANTTYLTDDASISMDSAQL